MFLQNVKKVRYTLKGMYSDEKDTSKITELFNRLFKYQEGDQDLTVDFWVSLTSWMFNFVVEQHGGKSDCWGDFPTDC